MADLSASSGPTTTGTDELVPLVRTHQANFVIEPHGENLTWTRLKCDGNACDFYIEADRWYDAMDAHARHFAEVIAASGVVVPVAEVREAVAEDRAQYGDSLAAAIRSAQAVAATWRSDDAASVVETLARADAVIALLARLAGEDR